MIYITNLLNHLKEWNILEYYHKDIATKIAEQCLQHYGKRNLDEEVEPNLTYLKMKIKGVRLVTVSRKVKMNSSQFSIVFFMELAEMQVQRAGAE